MAYIASFRDYHWHESANGECLFTDICLCRICAAFHSSHDLDCHREGTRLPTYHAYHGIASFCLLDHVVQYQCHLRVLCQPLYHCRGRTPPTTFLPLQQFLCDLP